MSSAGRPVKVKTTLMTGMLIFGKMSVGVRREEAMPKFRISRAITMNVYGCRRTHAGAIGYASGRATGPQSACHEPCVDEIASHVERRIVRAQSKRDDADAAGRVACHADQDCA